MPVIGTLLKEIWIVNPHWVLCYCAMTDDYMMELAEGADTKVIRAFTVEDVVRLTWMEYYGVKE